MKIRLLSLLLPLTALAAVQGPDAGGYSATDSVLYSFVDISGVGGGGTSILSGTDDSTVNVAMPFSFQFYGTAYNQVCVSSNGALYFLADSSACASVFDAFNTDLTAGAPSPDLAAVYPHWTDLTFQVAGAGSVFYQTVGTAPNRRFIVQWKNAFPQGSGNAVTFQAVLSETSNAISFQYQTVSLGAGNPASNGAAATIGMRNAGGQGSGQQLQWAFNAAVIADSTALAFTKGAGPLPPALTSPADGATSVSTVLTLQWAASAGATSYDVYFGSTNPPPLLANTTGTSIGVSGTNSKTYNWQVVAKNGAGNGASPIRSFTTVAPPPPPPPTPVDTSSSSVTSSPATISLTVPSSGAVTRQTITISLQSKTSGTFNYSAFTSTNQGTAWLSVLNPSGATRLASFADSVYTYTADITVEVNSASLGSGSFTGSVSVAAGAGVVSVPVTVTVADQPATLTTTPKVLSFVYRKGDTSPAAQRLAVTSRPAGAAYTASAFTSNGLKWLTAAPGTGGGIAVSVNGTVLSNLDAGSYAGRVVLGGSNALTTEIPVKVTVVATDAPLVLDGGVVPVFSSINVVQTGSWISIFGSKLASATAVWKGDFPTTLGGVSVTVNGKPAYLWFVSPTQINLQVPDDTATGPVDVVVTTPNGRFTATVNLGPASPSLSLLDATHVAALTPNPDGSLDVVGPAGAFSFPTRPVAAGDSLVLYGVGFGATNPPARAGQPVTGALRTVNPVTVKIAGVDAPVSFSGLVGSGLYQINVKVPAGVPSGDQPITASVSGLTTQDGNVVTIK